MVIHIPVGKVSFDDCDLFTWSLGCIGSFVPFIPPANSIALLDITSLILLEGRFRKRKKPVNGSWRMDETYIRVKGKWVYLYRAVDKYGDTIDLMLKAKRDKRAAKAFFKKAIKSNGHPIKVNIDKSGSNISALNSINKPLSEEDKIEIRQNKYLNNRIECDHRFIKKRTRPMLGFKCFRSAANTIAGIELLHMIKKG